MKNLNNNIRSRASRFLSLRVVLILCVLMVFAGFGVASAWNGGFDWLSMRKASAESKGAKTSPPASAPLVIGTCDVATAGLPIEVESVAPASGPTAYANLAAAIAAINAGTHQGAINVEVCFNSTETASMFLNSNAAAPAAYTSISIRPLADGLTISGPTIVGSGLIELNGADDVTIDGDNPNSAGTNRDLTITNTAVSTTTLTSVIRVAVVAAVPTANNITIRNLNINGSATARNVAGLTSTTASENSTFGIYAGGLATGATTAPAVLTSVSTNTAASGTTINNFNVTNNAVNACARGIFFNGAAATVSTLVTIANNTVGGAGALAGAPPYIAPTTTVYTKPVFVAGTTSVSITGNTIQNILSYVGTTMNGIELNSAIGSGGVTISDNTITGVVNNGTVSTANGIALSNSTSNPTVNGNTIANVQAVGSATVAGIILNHSSPATAGTAQRNRVSTVYTRGTGGFGSYGINVNSGSAWTLRNNMVWDINAFLNNGIISTTFGAHGIRVVTGTGHLIQNNSVNLFGAVVGSSSLSMLSSLTLISTGSTGMDVRNNILVNTMTGAPAGTPVDCIYLPAALPTSFNLTTNNNDYFSSLQLGQQGTAAVSGFTIAAFDSSTTAGATNWRNYTSTLLVANTNNDNASIKTDPFFALPTDLHLTAGSPARDVGAIIAAVTNDIDNEFRPGGNALYDIGADEFDGVPPPINDMQATAFLDPTNGGFKATGVAFSPQASFTNNGSATQTSVTVRYRICTDGTCTTEIYNNTAVIASIAPFATANVTFASTTIAVAGTYTIKARSELGTDTVPANDEITGTVILGGPLAGSYTVGTAGAYPSLTNPGGIFDAINSLGASGPLTIEIISDLTGETGAIALNPISGSPAVLIKPSGAPRTISGIAPIAVIRINGADNVRIDGSTAAARSSAPEVVGGTAALRELTVRNDNTGVFVGAVIALHSNTDGAQNNAIQNVNVDGNAPTTTIVGIHMGGAAIGSGGTDNDGNDVINCRIRRAFLGIYSVGASAANPNIGTRIEQNDISSTGADRVRRGGILVFNDDGIQIIENNVGGIDNTGEGADAYGIGVGTQNMDNAYVTAGGITNANVTRNRVNGVSQDATFSAFGIGIAGVNNGLNTVSNNMVTGVIADANAGDIVAGIFVAGVVGSNTRVYHNSVSMTGDRNALLTPAASQYPSYGIAITGADPIVELKNNIFYTTQTAALGTSPGAFSYGIGVATTTFANLNSDYNDYWSTGANDMGFRSHSLAVSAGTNYASVGLWSTAITDDVNSAILGEADPMYISPLNDLHLDGLTTPLLGDGITGFATIDYDSDPRPAIGPDIGADEIVQAEGGVIAGGTYYNALAIAGNTLGGPVTITNRMYLTGGVLSGGVNTLTIDCNASVIGASDTNYVDGNVLKNFCATGSFSFPVGDPATGSLAPPPLNGYMPVVVTVTALGTNPSSLAVSANNGLVLSAPPLNPLTTLSAFWTLTETGDLTATLAFNYQQGDVPGTANEAIFRVISSQGGPPTNYNTTVLDTGNNIATVPGIMTFSDWTVGEPLAPTSVTANIGGHVVDNTGAPLSGVTMTLLDTVLVENRTTVTDTNGDYFFNAILTGRQIVVTPAKNGYTFNPSNRAFNHTGELTSVDFVGTDSGSTRSVGSDFDGDGKADLSVFRPSDTTWYTLLSSTGVMKSQQWGLATDRIVPADYDGDHITDVAVFRPSNGTWYISQSSTSTLRAVNWGLAEDIVTPADFDGDGQADIAVFRPSTGTWYIIDSHNGLSRSVQWGTMGDRPVAADYNGDGKDDVAVWRPSNGIWYVMKPDGTYTNEHWGIEEDRAVVGDYDGDNRADLAVFRPSTATWYVKLSSDSSTNARGHGTAADILTPADYDGDGKTDRAVWLLGGDWNILRSTTDSTFGQHWGTTGDIPTTSAYVR